MKARCIYGGALAAALLALAAGPALPNPAPAPDLVKRATFVADTRNWSGQGVWEGSQTNIGIQWLSDKALLHNRFTGKPNHQQRVICRLDLRTGPDQPLPGLSEAMDELGPEVIDSDAPSPDGRWLLISDRWGDCLLAAVDGSRQYRYPSLDTGCYRSVFWMPDSRHWIEYFWDGGNYLVLHDVRHPGLSRSLPVGGKAGLLSSLGAVFSVSRAIAIVESDEDSGRPVHSVSVVQFSLDGSRPTRKLATIHAPHDTSDFDCSLSPKADRIAWDVAVRLPGDRCRSEVWVCDVDGRHMRRVGSIIRYGIRPDESPDYVGVKWMPGDQRLWFTWDDRLYTIGAR